MSLMNHTVTGKAGRLTRSVAVIAAVATVLSCVLFYFEEDINYAIAGMAAPALTKLVYSQTGDGNYKAVLNWKAKKGYYYQVLRKTTKTGRYRVVAKIKASSAKGSYTDTRIGKNKSFTYSVRRVTLKGSRVDQTGKYDAEGLTTLRTPSLSVDFTNLRGGLSWNKVAGATRYMIYRRVGKSSKFYKIKNIASGTLKYDDYWYWSTRTLKDKTYSKTLAGIITKRLQGVFLDASNNPVSYRIQAYSAKRVGLVKKESYGLYLKDGVFRLEAPSIVSITDDGVIKWGHVANAEGYRIYSSPDGKNWTKVKDVKSKGSDYIPASGAKNSQVYQEYTIPSFDANKYYTVRAYAAKNGKRFYGSYDTSFTIKNRGFDENVLYVGDSISFGSPYYNNERKIFSYENRISQLTGVKYFNPSIPGATYHFGVKDSATPEEATDSSTSKLVTGIMQMMVKGETTDKMTTTKAGFNKSHIYDYDVVVLAGGTNDYLHFDKASFKLGSRETDWTKIKDSDKTKDLTFTINSGTNIAKTYTESYDYNIKTFDGAYNQIMKWIEEASVYRVQHGKKPIQVVAMSMFYSDRAKAPYATPSNRDTTKNAIGLTLKDYQNELDYLNAKWAKSAGMKVYSYNTRSEGILDGKTCPYATADNLHLTKYTYAQFGNSLSSFMMKYFLGKEKDADAQSAEFIALAEKYGLLSDKLEYLEGLAASDMGLMAGNDEVLGLQSAEEQEDAELNVGVEQSSENDEEAELHPAVQEMISYMRLLYSCGYLDAMLAECSEEQRARYERFIEAYDITGEQAESGKSGVQSVDDDVEDVIADDSAADDAVIIYDAEEPGVSGSESGSPADPDDPEDADDTEDAPGSSDSENKEVWE